MSERHGDSSVTLEVHRHRFTIDEYHRMGEAGIFTEDDRVELIDGQVVQMTPIGSRHAGCVKRLNRLPGAAVGDLALVAVQDPISLGTDSEPQPDLVLLRPRRDFYASGHPTAGDIWLVIEVADTTLALDRGVKVPLYARAGISEVWLVDLTGSAVEVSRQPDGSGYVEVTRLGRGHRLTCQAFPDLHPDVDAILG